MAIGLIQMQNLVAQTEARQSKTGVDAADAQKDSKKGSLKGDGGILRVGPVTVSLGATLNETYNDNIGLNDKHQRDDIITTPSINANFSWPITKLNTLSASLGFGFSKYFNHPELDSDSLIITPTSGGEYAVYVGDIRLSLKTGLSIQQDPVAISQLSNIAVFRRMTSTMGAGLEWDMNRMILNLDYTLERFKSFENNFAFLNRNTSSFGGRTGVRWTSQLTAGLGATYSTTAYDNTDIQNDGSSYSVGPFADMVLTEYLSASANLNFQGSAFDTKVNNGGTIADNNGFKNFVWSLSVRNQLNRLLSHQIQYSRFTTLGIGSNFTEIDMVTYGFNLDLIKDLTSTVNFTYQWNKDSGGTSAEKAALWTFTPMISYPLIKNGAASLTYSHTEKETTRFESNYQQNTISVQLSYNF